MKPIIKYQGGKSKELSIIKTYISNKTERIIEPFCGGAAVSFGLEIPSILNDVNRDVINLYQVVANLELYQKLQIKVNETKHFEHNDLEKLFYHSRSIINQSFDDCDKFERAFSYIIVRQLCFSGMERYNSKGEFNVPFGHYQKFSCNLSLEHHQYLKTCIIQYGDALDCFNQVKENDFLFIDPPYLDRLGYSTGDGGLKLHQDLNNKIRECNNNWLIIHCDDEFYQESYIDFDIKTEDFKYSQRWGKNKNHSKSKVQHLYISNAPVTLAQPSTPLPNALEDLL